MLEHLKLHNVGPAPEMTLELSPRLNLITGDNGLGKSFLLDVAWWALTRRWPRELNPRLTSGYVAQPTDRSKEATIGFSLTSKTRTVSYISKYDPREQAWVGRSGRPWNPGLVIYAHADGGFSVWDPARNYWKTKGNVDVQERLPGYVFSAQEVWDGLRVESQGTPIVACNGLISDWASWIRENGPTARTMRQILEWLSPSPEASERLTPGSLTRISLNDARDIPTVRMGHGPPIPILHASSGVRRIVALAYILVWSYHEHVLSTQLIGEPATSQVILLVDEIESHLHPRWQRTILSSLLHLATSLHDQAKIQLLTATHSPLILASAEPLFDRAQDAWFDLDWERTGDEVLARLRHREFFPRGDVSNWLTSEAFDLRSARSLVAEQAIERARELLRRPGEPTLAEAREVDHQLRQAALPDIDPFWVRWSALVAKLEGKP